MCMYIYIYICIYIYIYIHIYMYKYQAEPDKCYGCARGFLLCAEMSGAKRGVHSYQGSIW